MGNLNSNKLNEAQEIIEGLNGEKIIVKRIRKDNGLLERTENNKVILAEDNRQLMMD